MDTPIPLESEAFGRVETPAERDERIRYESAAIAEARAEIDAGLGISEEDLQAWLDLLDTDENAPVPGPRSVRQQ